MGAGVTEDGRIRAYRRGCPVLLSHESVVEAGGVDLPRRYTCEDTDNVLWDCGPVRFVDTGMALY